MFNISCILYFFSTHVLNPYESPSNNKSISDSFHIPFLLPNPNSSVSIDSHFPVSLQKIDLELGYGPSADKAYTAVMPRTGYIFTYDKDGNRYEVKEGEREGTIDGKTYKFKSLAKSEDNEGDK